jgi:hypothetical protein
MKQYNDRMNCDKKRFVSVFVKISLPLQDLKGGHHRYSKRRKYIQREVHKA